MTLAAPPLAERLRPKVLDDVVGQDHLVGTDGILARTIASKKPLSIVLWGPPGCGKTSIARLYAQAFSFRFCALSAVFGSVSDLKRIVKEAQESPLLHRGTVVFVDEIHRFNKGQQEAFLPFIEDGTLVLVGATAENPSFHLSHALLSRTQVLTLKSLDTKALDRLLGIYEEKFSPLPLDSDARNQLITMAQGDGRYLFNMVEALEGLADKEIVTPERLSHVVQQRAALFDKGGEQHYNIVSALHKSIRGSDPDAALYWLGRMLAGGEDRLFIARRLIRMASEDIGLADPQALTQAIAARDAFQMLGSPEGDLALAQATVYLALAPKSNSLYTAFKDAQKSAHNTTHVPPPKHILNAPTALMRKEGYGLGYQYDHDTTHGFSGQDYFPEELGRQRYYHPQERGFEREMKKRLEYFASLRAKLAP